MKSIDVLIVGQGIAGSVLALLLERAGLSFQIVDNRQQESASKVAGGIINPVTGKRIAKSWELDRFLPAAQAFYKAAEKS